MKRKKKKDWFGGLFFLPVLVPKGRITPAFDESHCRGDVRERGGFRMQIRICRKDTEGGRENKVSIRSPARY